MCVRLFRLLYIGRGSVLIVDSVSMQNIFHMSVCAYAYTKSIDFCSHLTFYYDIILCIYIHITYIRTAILSDTILVMILCRKTTHTHSVV